MESVMFGHEKGASTGADRRTDGVFLDAGGGTVFLDEIGELSPAGQAALLRVLDTSRVCRVGSSREVAVDVRVLAATHRDLERMCEEGAFRQDLLYRINAMVITVPPLRERVEEIEPLAMRFMEEANQINGRRVDGFSNTTGGFTMRVRVYDASAVAAHVSHFSTLLYQVEYQQLNNTAHSYTTTLTPVTGLTFHGSHYRTEARVSGLFSSMIYRARITLYRQITGGKPTRIGDVSGWYYTVTRSRSTRALDNARIRIVLKALYENHLNHQFGLTGYMGKVYPYGQRYGATGRNQWCSEFYSWNADTALTIGSRTSIGKIVSYFTSRGGYAPVTNPLQIKYALKLGDYLSLDTNSSGNANHSVMVLDYDIAQDRVWTVEGNVSGRSDIGDSFDDRMAGNETMVKARRLGQLHGWGQLKSSMLD